MWKLHRYYLKELAVNAGITFLVLFAIVLVSLIARGIQRAQGGGLLDAALITLFWALDSFPHLLTIAFLIATVLTFTRASQDRELIAIRAAGLSPRVPMTAAVLVGITLSVIGSLALHYVIPDVHFRKYRVIAEVVRNAFVNLRLGSDRIKVLETGFVMTFRRQEDYEYFDCILYCPPDRTLGDLESPILHVDKIAIPPPDPHAEVISIVLSGLQDPIGGAALDALPISLSLHDLINRERREDSNEDVRSDQLLAEVLRGVHRAPHEALYTIFRRCCFALMPALLAPIGYCIAEFARERGRMVALVLALVPLSLFYVGEVLGARLLPTTQNPWCGWLPGALLLAGGLPLCWRQLRR
ncbi:MAG TPA: LptF/LptG family permease [Planctomycetota bacterium]